jgi:iron-sulfur cluster repair protein YtfE (RIC family)
MCLADRAQVRSLTDDERSAVKAALQYFHAGGERHTSDEEESLFPRLRAEAAIGSLQKIDRLESDHQHAAHLHDSVDWLYTAWISAGTLEQDKQQRLLAEKRELRQLYAGHIQIEETTVFPRAVMVLTRGAVAATGAEFSARRK